MCSIKAFGTLMMPFQVSSQTTNIHRRQPPISNRSDLKAQINKNASGWPLWS